MSHGPFFNIVAPDQLFCHTYRKRPFLKNHNFLFCFGKGIVKKDQLFTIEKKRKNNCLRIFYCAKYQKYYSFCATIDHAQIPYFI